MRVKKFLNDVLNVKILSDFLMKEEFSPVKNRQNFL